MYRLQLEDKIIQVLSQSPKALTRLEIARALNRAKSPHLIYCIEHLHAQGLLTKMEGKNHQGRPAWVYSL